MGVLVVGADLEEVAIQGLADSEKGLGMDPRVAENLVEVLASAVDLGGQPSDAAPLPLQFGLDEFPKMEFLVGAMLFFLHVASRCLRLRPLPEKQQKKRETFCITYRCGLFLDYQCKKVKHKIHA